MAKDPAFLWYPGDYIAGTTEYNFEEKGAYVEILMKQFEHGGPLPEEKIKRILRESYSRIWSVICEKFKQDENGSWYNERLEIERSKRKNFTESRRNNLKSKKSSHKADHMDIHKEKHTAVRMENENININEDVIKNKKETADFFIEVEKLTDRVKIIEAIMTDEIYIEQLQITHRGKDIKKAFDECYIHHSNAPNPPSTVGEWRQKLNTWLINTKNGTSKTNRGDAVNARREAFARKHGTSVGN